MSSSSGAPPSLDSVHQMKQFLTANRVSFADCVEKSDLVRRVQETQAKIAAQPTQQQAKACDCMQGAPHSHDAAAAAAAAAASSSAASKAKKEGGGESELASQRNALRLHLTATAAAGTWCVAHSHAPIALRWSRL